IYRATIVYRMSQPDASWPDVDPPIWATVEMNIGIFSACLPTLHPVVHWIAHGGTYKKRESEGHLQKRLSWIKSKRGPLSWLLPNSLMPSTEEAERV
ncbi:hypothetical protein MMC29_002027, partial [Sticta canariensis]|nr:hypothetical protein [Sticta canariensis]